MDASIIQSEYGIAELRTQCGAMRDLLIELTNIHFEVDEPSRIMEEGEPEWLGRMRKILLHILAINQWEIGREVEHVLAPEIRAVFEQLSVVWKNLSASSRLADMDEEWWAKEARSGMVADYSHPTALKLALSPENGGFSTEENGLVYARLILWLGSLGLGYGIALVHLSEVLGSGKDVESRVTAMFEKYPLTTPDDWVVQANCI